MGRRRRRADHTDNARTQRRMYSRQGAHRITVRPCLLYFLYGTSTRGQFFGLIQYGGINSDMEFTRWKNGKLLQAEEYGTLYKEFTAAV